MSNRKRPRPKSCILCGQRRTVTPHDKCYNCRISIVVLRFAVAGKFDKFVSRERPWVGL